MCIQNWRCKLSLRNICICNWLELITNCRRKVIYIRQVKRYIIFILWDSTPWLALIILKIGQRTFLVKTIVQKNGCPFLRISAMLPRLAMLDSSDWRRIIRCRASGLIIFFGSAVTWLTVFILSWTNQCLNITLSTKQNKKNNNYLPPEIRVNIKTYEIKQPEKNMIKIIIWHSQVEDGQSFYNKFRFMVKISEIPTIDII
mgnify:CR=1 FL=1